ncbi:MAG: D-tyrosyl-tRNA(Tyr) deacylase [Flavobacteriaceae bacterium]|nr:D-tyrosyl-tRNA(Tyr) deacylase [Flavobacteriaceae bacterium]
MKVVLQRVSKASVSINNSLESSIGNGLLILLGIHPEDTQEDIDWLVKKIGNMRIFEDENGVMNFSVLDVKGEVLVVSQFTLQASTKKGNRPSYIKAARPVVAIPLYEAFKKQLASCISIDVKSGVFGADMQVAMVNDGPITIILDSMAKV